MLLKHQVKETYSIKEIIKLKHQLKLPDRAISILAQASAAVL